MPDPKKELRRTVKACLAALSDAERQARSAQAVARLLACPEYQRARTVMAFDSWGTEIDTHALLVEILSAGKTLVLPRTCRENSDLTVHRIADLAHDLETCRLGFREPKAQTPQVPLEQLELVIVPGLAYDRRGNRLGRGRGCYDRLLALAPPQAEPAAILYDCQLVEEVPALPHDQPVHLLVTETQVIRVRSR